VCLIWDDALSYKSGGGGGGVVRDEIVVKAGKKFPFSVALPFV
jgi:hypothetical protein